MWKADHFGVRVTDMDRAIGFYAGALGMKLLARDINNEGKPQYCFDEFALLELDGCNLELVKYSGKSTAGVAANEPPYCPHIFLKTEDFDATLKMIREKGISVVHGPLSMPGAQWIFVSDPDEISSNSLSGKDLVRSSGKLPVATFADFNI